MILLREKDVDIPGLQGDLEYIPFVPEDESQVFSKLSEMINTLLAEAAGRHIDVSVQEKQAEPPHIDEQSIPSEQNEESKSEDTGPATPSLASHFVEMIEASEKRDLAKVEAEYQAGKELIAKGVVPAFDPLVWETVSLQYKFAAGSAKALDDLRKLSVENPQRPEPPMRIADVLFDSQEYAEAAELYSKASGLANPASSLRATALIRAVKAYSKSHQNSRARETAWKAYQESAGDQKREVASLLYEILKDEKETFFALGFAEAAIRDNPQHPLRFQLGLDYRAARMNDLFLLHFDYMYHGDSGNSSALHNLALALSSCDLPITSVEHYKKAIEAGETLSAANLGYKYLDAGMAEDAKGVLQPAMQEEQHDTRVDICFADIGSRTKAEGEKREGILESAQDKRKFFIQMGDGLQEKAITIDGDWIFPFGRITLATKNNEVSGTTEIQTPETGFGSAFLGLGKTDSVKTEIYTFTGKLTGNNCKYVLTIENKAFRATILARVETKEGYLVFDSNAETGTLAELKDGLLGDRQSVSRAAAAAA